MRELRMILVLLAVVALVACALQARRGSQSEPTPPAPVVRSTPSVVPAATPTATIPPPSTPVNAPKALPVLDHEPVLGVLIARAPRVTISLAAPTRLEGGGSVLNLPAGSITIEGLAGGWRLAGGGTVLGEGVLRGNAGRPIFGIEAIPVFGKNVAMKLAGDLLIHPHQGQIEIIERVGMEEYIASVVAAEMNPKWPERALAAQAIVARSYAASRWMERHSQAWQLHWHFGVDMAYHGWRSDHDAVIRAIAPTRGEVLMFRGFPVLALFHASTGGRTEAFSRIKPGVFAPDGKTSIAEAMPIVEDPAALPGAAGLNLSASHGQWKADIPLPEVTKALQDWSTKARGRPTFGEVEAVSIGERYADSGRVGTVSIRHRLDGQARFLTMAATDFRMAVSPVRIRSTWWDRCVIAAKAPGYLVLQGRGFGHGCGLSQVSAWHLAKQGVSPEDIVGRFYAGARIERKY